MSWKLYSEEMLVNKFDGIINSDKFARIYDDLYFGVTFWECKRRYYYVYLYVYVRA